MNKKGLELSINLITILIISIFVLALAIFALTTFVGKTKEVSEQVSAQLQAQTLELLTTSNEKTAVPVFRHELQTGGTYTFAMGIQNLLEQDYDFKVHMQFVEARAEPGKRVAIEPEKWIFELQGPFTLEPGDKKVVALPVRAANAEKDVTYIFQVWASCNGPAALCEPYGYKQTVEVDVVG
ncbi:hypothetical protein KY311_01450 [Candidatus Woesearchaeota archaeon]|nr:hypothetical protein [Candidatus Woesearchaeota archaeon]